MHESPNRGTVVAVCRNAQPGLPKLPVDALHLIEDIGADGDYHAGRLVRHRYLVNKDPTRPNLRQVLLADTSILAEIAAQGIRLDAGMLGENMLLDGIAVMGLAVGTRVEVGEAMLELTEVRKPCHQLNEIHPGLLDAVQSGPTRPNAGMLARVVRGGAVRPGDPVIVR